MISCFHLLNQLKNFCSGDLDQVVKNLKSKNPQTACVAVKRMYDRVHSSNIVMYFKLSDGTIREMWDPWEGGPYFGELMEATGTKFDTKDAFTLLHELYEQLPFN